MLFPNVARVMEDIVPLDYLYVQLVFWLSGEYVVDCSSKTMAASCGYRRPTRAT